MAGSFPTVLESTEDLIVDWDHISVIKNFIINAINSFMKAIIVIHEYASDNSFSLIRAPFPCHDGIPFTQWPLGAMM